MARSFASGDNIDCGTAVTSGVAKLSFAVWVNPASLTPALSAIYSKNESSSYNQIMIRSDGKLASYLKTTGGTSFIDPGSATISTGAWTHIGLTYDNAIGLSTYVNGASDGTYVFALGDLTGFTGTTKTYFGKDSVNAGRDYVGAVAECAQWTTDLNAAEFAALAKGYSPLLIRPSKLVAYWSLVRNMTDIIERNDGTATGTSVSAHPRIIMPSSRKIRKSVTVLAAPLRAQIWM